ncbi:MAG: PH domain-containing protein [Natronosporangium sp.]
MTAIYPGNGRPGSSAVAKYLLPSERVVIIQRRHWAVLTAAFSLMLGGLLFAFAIDTALPQSTPYVRDVLWLGWLGLVGFFMWNLFEWWFDRFIVSDRRIMLITGLITRKVAMMPLIKVTDMSYQRSPLGRMLGYGEFVMESAGQDQALRSVRFVAHPDWLYREMCGLLFGSPAAPAPPATSVARSGGPSSEGEGARAGRVGRSPGRSEDSGTTVVRPVPSAED